MTLTFKNTGSQISIIPKSFLSGTIIHPTLISAITANSQSIEISGQAQLSINIKNLRRDFNWTFIVAETIKPLLGYDFLNHFGIIVDCGKNEIIDSLTNQTTTTTPTSIVMNIKVEQIFQPDVQNIINKYPNLISPHHNPNAKTPKTAKSVVNTVAMVPQPM